MEDYIRSTEAAFMHIPKIFKATAANSLQLPSTYDQYLKISSSNCSKISLLNSSAF
jgi:hypothetical protein